MTRDEATTHDPLGLSMPTQLAEIIGQLQHLIDLSESASGRNIYDPLVIDLSQGTAQTVALPSESHTIVGVTLSSDTAATVQLYRVDPYAGPSGKLVGQVYLPAAAVAVYVRLDCPVSPTAASLKVVTSAAIVHGAAVVTLAQLRSGRYPNVG